MNKFNISMDILKRKRRAELRVIFRMASEAAANATLPPDDRDAAARTCLYVRCVLTLKP